AAALGPALAQAREQSEGLLQVFLEMLLGRGESAELQVLGHCHMRKDAAPFGRLSYPAADDREGLLAGDVPPFEQDLPPASARIAADRHQQGGFARAV